MPFQYLSFSPKTVRSNRMSIKIFKTFVSTRCTGANDIRNSLLSFPKISKPPALRRVHTLRLIQTQFRPQKMHSPKLYKRPSSSSGKTHGHSHCVHPRESLSLHHTGQQDRYTHTPTQPPRIRREKAKGKKSHVNRERAEFSRCVCVCIPCIRTSLVTRTPVEIIAPARSPAM